MTNYVVVAICSHSVAIAAIAGAIRYRFTEAAYRPFLLFLFLASVNETISSLLIFYQFNSSVNGNVYVLLEFLLIMQLFKKWGIAQNKHKFYTVATVALGTLWLIDNFAIGSITTVNSLFRLVSSLTLVFLSVDQMNRALLLEQMHPFKNAKFTICTGFISFYTVKALFESLFVFDPGLSNAFFEGLMLILVVVNVIANLIYFIAVLWMPMKKKYSLHYL